MSRTPLFLLGLLGFAILCFLCVTCHGPGMLDEFGMVESTGVEVDAAIAGRTQPEAQPADLEPATRTAARPAALLWSAQGDRIVLKGKVPSEEARQSLLAAARASWGDGNVVDELEIDADTDTFGWPDSFARLMNALKSRGGDMDLSLSGGELTVDGNVLSELERERTLGALSTALPGIGLIDRLEVRGAATETEQLQATLDEQLQGKIVEFEKNSDQLTARGRGVLDDVAKVLEATSGRLEISGHTDSDGAAAYNLDLSRRRAETVRRYLAGKGLDSNRFETAGYGETRPIADNSTLEGKQRNRRTEFRAL